MLVLAEELGQLGADATSPQHGLLLSLLLGLLLCLETCQGLRLLQPWVCQARETHPLDLQAKDAQIRGCSQAFCRHLVRLAAVPARPAGRLLQPWVCQATQPEPSAQ